MIFFATIAYAYYFIYSFKQIKEKKFLTKASFFVTRFFFRPITLMSKLSIFSHDKLPLNTEVVLPVSGRRRSEKTSLSTTRQWWTTCSDFSRFVTNNMFFRLESQSNKVKIHKKGKRWSSLIILLLFLRFCQNSITLHALFNSQPFLSV